MQERDRRSLAGEKVRYLGSIRRPLPTGNGPRTMGFDPELDHAFDDKFARSNRTHSQ